MTGHLNGGKGQLNPVLGDVFFVYSQTKGALEHCKEI